MEDIKSILFERMPCWYELSWREQLGVGGMVLRIHKDFASGVKPIPKDAPIVEHFKRDFGFTKFGREFGKDFGFEDSLKFLGEAGEFLEYSIPTPLVRKPTGKTCRSCKGTGWDESREDTCMYCNGERQEIGYDYTETFAISASLTTLFELMLFPEIETSCSLPQLICVNTVTIRSSHGGSLSGEYSRETVDWLKRHELGEIPEMVSTMCVTWERMDGRMKDFDIHSFEAYLPDNDGRLLISCPGDCCGLYPSGNYGKDRGLKISCHNTDTPQQQLTLVASLAALHKLVREGTT